jgi:hypothetical protein
VLVAFPLIVHRGSVRSIDGTLEISVFGDRPPARSWWRHVPFVAITLGHVIVGVSDDVLHELRAHEQAHVRQYERWGPFFLPAYALASLGALVRGGRPYVDNVFEIDARRVAAEAALLARRARALVPHDAARHRDRL